MKLDEAYGKYMTEFIRRICSEIGPRLGTTENEKRAGLETKKEYERFCDETHSEGFECRPRAFLDFIWVSTFLFIAGAALYLFYPAFTAILGALTLLVFLFEQMFLKEAVDFLFPRGESANIFGKIKPKEKPKYLVLIGSHHDSAYEFPLFNKLGKNVIKFTYLTVGVGLLTILLATIRTVNQFMDLGFNELLDLLFVVPLLGCVFITYFALNLRSSRLVIGANDNLSGVAVTLAIAKYLHENRPKNTEVWIISFGCEECMRGSKRFASKHAPELGEAFLVNFDSVGIGRIAIVDKEKMFTATHSPELCKMLQESARKVGFPVDIRAMDFGGTDAANFSKAGLKAATIIGLDASFWRFWHSLEDTPQIIEKENLLTCAEIGIQFIQDLDSGS
jgi:hypothetical protein